MLLSLQAALIDGDGAIEGGPGERERVIRRVKHLQVLIITFVLLNTSEQILLLRL